MILNWNGKDFLDRFLPALLGTNYPDIEVVVADNGSTDGTVAFLQERYPNVRIIAFDRNHGFTGGYNRALQQVSAPYYVLLNSDVEVAPDWLTPMVDLLERYPDIAACQPKLLCWGDRHRFEYAGAAGGWIDRLGYPFAMGRLFDHMEEDRGQYDQARPIFWASGACLFIRSSAFHAAGGFDEYFFAHQEEIDLCWRIQLAGHRIFSCPGSVVWHVGGGTLPKGRSLKTFLNFRNNRILIAKNMPLRQQLQVVPLRFLLDMISALKGLLSGDPGYCWSVCRAHMAFIRWWLFHRKKSIFPPSRKGELTGRYKGNVAWQYFVKKKSRFSDLVK
ncbi:MAG: hypothetical protein RJA57_1685, partial [Bacteroidota bacterium]